MKWQSLLRGLCVFVFFTPALRAADVPFVWIESENPTARQGIKEWKTWEHEYFSGKWAHISVDADKLDAMIDGDAILLKYDFESTAGTFELWNRVGFEYVRSPFEWRIDGGDWKTAKPDDLTIDLMEVGFWCEIAWLKLGDVSLQQGKHTLEIQLAKQKAADGNPEKILYASDCICLYPGKFQPYSKFKPNEDHRTEKDIEAAKKQWNTNNIVFSTDSISLKGIWEICRDDEYLPEPVTQPISRLPDTTRWSAIQVPGDKNELRPDLQFAHRVWYRTKVELPAYYNKQSAFIDFPQNNLNTTVYVNGQLCGFNKNPFVKFRIDISKAIKPGVNEIYVGIRDAWYARTEKAGDPMKLRKTFNIPEKYFGDGFQDLVYPIWNHPQSGILQTPLLRVIDGPVYVDDMFAKPSVANKELAVDVTLKNISDADQTVDLSIVCWERHLWTFEGEEEKAKLSIPPFGKLVSDEDFHGYAILDNDKIDVSRYHSQPLNISKNKKFETKAVTVKANSELVVQFKEAWEEPKLWTPDKPHLYTLLSYMRGKDEQGKDFASNEALYFGFREWSIDGKNFLLNGVPFHGRADCFEQPTKEKWLQFYRDTNQSVMRFWGTKWQNMPPEDSLRFFDENGVVVRRSGIFDGEAIGYNVIENDQELRAKNKTEDPAKEEIKMDLFRNWRDQMVAQVKGERNHPSVMLWSIENEILYINCINLYGGLMDQFEDEIIKTAQAVKEADPTRPSMTDGGGATKRGNPGQKPGDGLEIHGDHYMIKDDFTKYPDRTYEVTPEGGGHGNRWIWDQNRPRFIGEDFYVNGYLPADFATIGGEEAFQGRTGARKAVGLLYKMLTEGYRWNEFGAWQFWVDQNRAVDQYHSNAPIAVLCKEWDWTFEAGETVKRTFKIFNDTQKDEVIAFEIKLIQPLLPQPSMPNPEVHDKVFSREFSVKAGKSVELPWSFVARGSARMLFRDWAKLQLNLYTDGNLVFQDEKDVSILAVTHDYIGMASKHPASLEGRQNDGEILPPTVPVPTKSLDHFSLFVYDPHKSLDSFFAKYRITYKTIDSLENIPKGEYGKTILIVGKDAITPENCDSTALQAFAAQGNGVVVLEQKNPLRFSALPCEMEPSVNEGRIGFMENESHPMFSNLKQKDFFTWPDGHVLYRNTYKKPSRGAKSLLQCDQRLENCAVVEIPVGQGVMILSQLLVGEKIEKSVVAKQLLGNMVRYAADYKLQYTPVVVCTDGLDKNFLKELDAMQLKYTTVSDATKAIQSTRSEIRLIPAHEPGGKYVPDHTTWKQNRATVIISATPENLKKLAGLSNELESLYGSGGTILLHGLAPEGLVDFNNLVGVDHLMREFRRERVGFPAHRNPLTQGLSLSDIAMSSGERMFGWANDEFVASDTYSYVVDLEDVAPFATYKNDFERMMSNGMVSADGWPYIVNIAAPDQPPLDFSLKFPKPVELCEVTWTGNTFYYPVTKFGLFFDGKSQDGRFFDVEPNTEPQTFAVDPTLAGKELTLRLADWTVLPDKGKTTGLDNIVLKQKRPDDFAQKVHPLLNIGAMVHYPKRDGSPSDLSGIVLCNLKFPDREAVPLNAVKKRNILATILRNLGAEFVESKTVVAGTPMQDTPVDISKKCNGFRSARGWLDGDFTFEAMPHGLQKFAGVTFDIFDFPTSPTPNCVIVRDQNVEGIAVNQKADALFFLHTMKLDARRNRDEIRDGKTFETLKYVVHYEDGERTEIPIVAETDIENYCQKEVTPISGAMLGWVRKDEKTSENAVAYIKQWNNPHPEKTIASLDIVRGKEPRGPAAVLAVTAAKTIPRLPGNDVTTTPSK